jgi:hypothetical protein
MLCLTQYVRNLDGDGAVYLTPGLADGFVYIATDMPDGKGGRIVTRQQVPVEFIRKANVAVSEWEVASAKVRQPKLGKGS